MRQPSEEEIKALEAELEKLTVDDVLLQTVVTLVNLGARKAGLAEGTEADLPQVKMAIDGARALLPAARAGPRRAPGAGARRRVAAADGLCAEIRRRGARAGGRRRSPSRRSPAGPARRRARAASGFQGSNAAPRDRLRRSAAARWAAAFVVY